MPNFDGLCFTMLKLFSEKGDCVASQGVLRIAVYVTGPAAKIGHVGT